MIAVKKCNFKKIIWLGLVQLIFQVVLFIFGFNFEPNSDSISSNFLEILTKVQITNSFQNFIWCFTNNLAVLFIVFWLSYWSWGILGTLWCANSSFVMGKLIKLSLVINSWISICFILLELIASWVVIVSSTYFRIDKCLKVELREKYILRIMGIIAIILILAAFLETLALNLI